MTAKRMAIINAVRDAIATKVSFATLDINTSGEPGADEEFPAIYIVDRGDRDPENTEPGMLHNIMPLSIEWYVQGADGAGAHAEINQLYVEIVEAVMADETLGGLAQQIDQGRIGIDTAVLASSPRKFAALEFNILYTTDRRTPAL